MTALAIHLGEGGIVAFLPACMAGLLWLRKVA